VSTQTLGLQQTWQHACAGLPEGHARVWSVLEEGLARAEEADLDEKQLLTLVDTAKAAAEAENLSAETVVQLDRNLRRAVYEYLLALDAATVAEIAPGGGAGVAIPAVQSSIATDAPMIGIEEVAEVGKTTVLPPPPQSGNHRDLIRSASAAVEFAEQEQASEASQHRHRFGFFRRSPRDDEIARAGDDDGDQGFAVASRDGFHIGHPTDLLQQVPSRTANSGTDVEPEAKLPSAEPPPQPLPDVPEMAARPAPDRSPPSTSSADITQTRRDIDERLRRKHCDEAAALLQQLAHEVGGREVAELAVDAGDRCRGLGKRRAATNSYLAAARSDPVFAIPLLRLADICIDDKDIDLAVSYLERVARLSRLSGDLEGALRVYRKIAAVAPYREDVLELLLRAQTTGRIDS